MNLRRVTLFRSFLKARTVLRLWVVLLLLTKAHVAHGDGLVVHVDGLQGQPKPDPLDQNAMLNDLPQQPSSRQDHVQLELTKGQNSSDKGDIK